MLKVAVFGASGYAGGELLRLIQSHPEMTLFAAIANSQAGESIRSVFPNLNLELERFDSFAQVDLDSADAFFLALPHGESAKIMNDLPNRALVVDLGADYRLADSDQWSQYYETVHAGSLVYGLADIPANREVISQSNRIANPGCYATAINLSLAPFVAKGVIKTDLINIVASSGTSGAGRKASTHLLSAENMNNMSAYKVGGIHQHTPEIEQFLGSLTNENVRITFTPILAPMPRGIISVTHASLNGNWAESDLRLIFNDFYGENKFIQLLDSSVQPQTKAVIGTNYVQFQLALDPRANQIVITCVIDNLIKGAAGQAIQNLNLMAGFDYFSGLENTGMFP